MGEKPRHAGLDGGAPGLVEPSFRGRQHAGGGRGGGGALDPRKPLQESTKKAPGTWAERATDQDTCVSSTWCPLAPAEHACLSTQPRGEPLSTPHVGERGLSRRKNRHAPSKQHTAANSRAPMWPKGQAPTFVFLTTTPYTRCAPERGGRGKREKNISITTITTLRKMIKTYLIR